MVRFTKEVTNKLIKYVTRIDIQFNPFDGRSKAAREMWRQMKAQRYYQANPKLSLDLKQVSTPVPPVVKFSFVDGSNMDFDCEQQHCKEMLHGVWEHARDMDFEFEMTDKNIDDLM
mmetsp:Transcript_28924/g.42890  ORF Transcript_28924/g.42890 Transcript_28924/m.42890 type:complete len:116 (+) Transcript_28924:191-538(+)